MSSAPVVVREPHKKQVDLVEDTMVVHQIGVVEPQYCEDVGRQCGLVRRLALGTRLG